MVKLGLKNLDLQNRRVLLRVDFNVPLDEKGNITDDSRIRAALPTIQTILDHRASLVIMSHLGRPKSKDPKLSLAVCAKKLSSLLQREVLFAPDCVGPQVEKMASTLKMGQILMLENLRFHEAEEKPELDPGFAASLAKLGDVYVNDAFGTAHRAHSSTAIIAKYFPKKAAMGFLMENEISHLSMLLHQPKRPFYAIIGGAKISTKIGVIRHLLEKVDRLFLGGAMAFSFFKAMGIEVGKSPCNEEEVKIAKEILSTTKKISLPLDIVIAESFENDAQNKVILVKEGILPSWQGMDVGPETVKEWGRELQNGSTIFWNGPLGVFEMPSFAKGTFEIAKILSESKAKVIIGGGDSVAAIVKMGLQNKFLHLSTGGGASLEFLEFGSLPGIDALSDV